MRSDLYKEMYELEESYWWHVAKRRLVKMFLQQYLTSFSDKEYVDVGCGTGKLLEEKKKWKKWKRVIGLDGSDQALNFCRRRGITEVRKEDFEKKLTLKTESVDVITCLDVVEHVEKDQELLKEFYRVLRPGGYSVITVPAYQWMWTYWDDILGHKRRYTKIEVELKFVKAGFKVTKISYFYSYLLPIALLFRFVKSFSPKTKGSSDFIALPHWVNQILLAFSAVETRLVKNVTLPIGLSVVCVAQKI